jgi:hypothetical protein
MANGLPLTLPISPDTIRWRLAAIVELRKLGIERKYVELPGGAHRWARGNDELKHGRRSALGGGLLRVRPRLTDTGAVDDDDSWVGARGDRGQLFASELFLQAFGTEAEGVKHLSACAFAGGDGEEEVFGGYCALVL